MITDQIRSFLIFLLEKYGHAILLYDVRYLTYKMNGPMFNIYHVSPAQTQNPDEYVTEACFPVE